MQSVIMSSVSVLCLIPKLWSFSGGVDRTGLVVAMETALLKMEVVEHIDPLDIVRSMRDKRGMMVPAVVSYISQQRATYMCKGHMHV